MKIEIFENLRDLSPYVAGAIVLVWVIERIVRAIVRKGK